mmetsp:Transcript_2398/g.2682  ORF Transcript_2398/g.2682 Transcript_2398/m.2682 type:complete len:206 (-) Transcript_2398:34-651(-)
MTTYKLTYFNTRGRGEIIRYLFIAAKQDYEDNRFDFATKWADIKPTTPFGQVPILEVTENGTTTKYGQTSAIVRHLARKFNLYGSNEADMFLIDIMDECFAEIFEESYIIRFKIPEESREKEMKKLKEEIVPEKIKRLEPYFAKNKGPYLLGDKLSLADIALARFTDDFDVDGSICKTLPNLQTARAATDEIFKEWRENRPKTQY